MNTIFIKVVTGILLSSVLAVGGYAAKVTFENSLKVATLEQAVRDFKDSQSRMENKIDWMIEQIAKGE